MADDMDVVIENTQQFDPVVKTWLSYRQEVLLLYFSCVSLDTGKVSPDGPNQSATLLCQSLMDYLSMGHFQVYEHLMSQGDTVYQSERDFIHTTFEKIQKNTQIFVDFNDKYERSETELDLPSFVRDLSSLGTELETRFALEDALLKKLVR